MSVWLLKSLLMVSAWQADPGFDGPPADWLLENAPFGADITLDGKVWVNSNPVGARDDYAILADDLYKVRTSGTRRPRVWIRGYHLKNPRVKYRESKLLVSIDCDRDTIWTERRLFYAADGEVISSDGPFATEPIVPGSIGESWQKAACAQ